MSANRTLKPEANYALEIRVLRHIKTQGRVAWKSWQTHPVRAPLLRQLYKDGLLVKRTFKLPEPIAFKTPSKPQKTIVGYELSERGAQVLKELGL